MVHHNMAIKIGTEPCNNSPSGRGCVYKPVGTPAIGDGKVKHIWSCRRCGDKTYEIFDSKEVECAISHNGIHQWETQKTLSFVQHYKYREISESQKCSCCGSERIYEYQSMIGHNPHWKRN